MSCSSVLPQGGTFLSQSQISQMQGFLERAQLLTSGEKVEKWALKALVMIGGVIAGAALSGLLSAIPIHFLGAGIGTGLAFLVTIKISQVVDDYFIRQATQRALLGDSATGGIELQN